MNEKHFAVIERSLLGISETRRKLRAAAKEIGEDGADGHLVDALNTADKDLEQAYNRMFQDTYFHVSKEQMDKAGRNAESAPEDPAEELPEKPPVEVPEPTEELKLSKSDESVDKLSQ